MFALVSAVNQGKPMKPTNQAPEKNFGKDMKMFERLPAKTKELVILKPRVTQVGLTPPTTPISTHSSR